MNHLPRMPEPFKVTLRMQKIEDLKWELSQAEHMREMHKAVCPNCSSKQMEEMIADGQCDAGRAVSINYQNACRALRMGGG